VQEVHLEVKNGAGVRYLPAFLLKLPSHELQTYSLAHRGFEHHYVGQWLGGRGEGKSGFSHCSEVHQGKGGGVCIACLSFSTFRQYHGVTSAFWGMRISYVMDSK